MASVLVVDDDEIFSEMLSDMISHSGHTSTKATTIRDALKLALSEPFDVVFLDIHLPDGNGLDVLPKIREAPSSPEIIIVTGYGDSNGAELAIKNGAWDYIEKPTSVKEMTLTLVRSIQYREEKRQKTPAVALRQEGIVGSSPQIKACLNLVAQAAQSDAGVLITGETGTGKELFALAIHNNSRRAEKNFVVVDCASLPETLVESILFGHEKGAFTGAEKAREGLVKQANGGTLFLDEIGELPPSLQKSFLRVLQGHRFRPLGAEKEIESDFRLISATNRNITSMIKEGRFREDLLFRVRTLSVDLPPLRGRPGDIKELLIHYMTKLCERYGIGTKGFAPEFLDALLNYDWPGNVRELIGTLEKALSEAFNEPTLYPKHLPIDLRVRLKKTELVRDTAPNGGERPAPHSAESARPPASEPLPTIKAFREEAISQAERRYLEDLLKAAGGNIKEACRVAGMSRPRLYALLKKFNMTKHVR
ncbi:MAG TPA: sigma-54 dependent transcriptional regulator [Syntrophorhabdaceae bacterium]|nr:sigma-54 dependent transcriptional regulator [Syntrophorhabdaceae bacterium]